MTFLIHVFCPMFLLGTIGCGNDPPRKEMLGQPPLEKTAASEAFTEVQVLVNGNEATNGIFTVRKSTEPLSITVTMQVDKKFGPVELVYATTKQHDGVRWLTTSTSIHRKPDVMNNGKLKVLLETPTPVRTGENLLRIQAMGEPDEPVYVAEGVIRVVEKE